MIKIVFIGLLILKNSIFDRSRLKFSANIEVGLFRIELSNGRVLWEGEIEKKDIQISKEQQIDYKLAAKTDKPDSEPTREIRLLNDEIIVRVFAGLEFGKMELVLK